MQLLTTQADHHDFTAKIGVEADVAQRAYRDFGARRVDGDTTAIAVLKPDHAVHIRIERQQLALDALHRHLEHTRHALHGGSDGQKVAGAHRTIGVHKALEGVALDRRPLGRWPCRHGQALQLARSRNVQQPLMHPAARGNRFTCVTHRHVVAQHGLPGRDVAQRQLVALRHPVAQGQSCSGPLGHHGASRQARLIGNDGHVVIRVHADGQRRRSCTHGVRHLSRPGSHKEKAGTYVTASKVMQSAP